MKNSTQKLIVTPVYGIELKDFANFIVFYFNIFEFDLFSGSVVDFNRDWPILSQEPDDEYCQDKNTRKIIKSSAT